MKTEMFNKIDELASFDKTLDKLDETHPGAGLEMYFEEYQCGWYMALERLEELQAQGKVRIEILP